MQIFKNFKGSMPQDLLKLFLFLNQLQIVLLKQIRLKKCENYVPLPFQKFSLRCF